MQLQLPLPTPLSGEWDLSYLGLRPPGGSVPAATASDKKRGPWIQTAPSNTRFYLADPRPEEIRIEDVAYHLAGINRYTGGSRISVAQHCVVASRMARRHYTPAQYPERNVQWLPAKMLVHDSHESFYGDASSPLKSLLPDYRALELVGETCFEKRFDLMWVEDTLVKEIDRRTMFMERNHVFTVPLSWDGEWNLDIGKPAFEPEDDDMEPWEPGKAEEEWLTAFYNLLPWVDRDTW